MEAERILELGVNLNKTSEDLDFLQDDLKFCKHFKVSAEDEFHQSVENSNEEEACKGYKCVTLQQESSSFCQSGVPSRLPTSTCDFSTLGDKLNKLTENDQDFSFAREMLLSGFTSFAKDVSIVQIYRCSHTSLWGHARLQAFQIQEQITSSTRGDTNVRYAWHGTSKEGVFGIIRFGFGQPRVAKNGDAFGVGVYLAPTNASHVSAMYSDVDESGEQHIILCKVILGRTEQVSLGSQQFHPSSEEFDSGVDDCTRPKRYIVWSTHMNTHILPMFVISFKLSTITQEVVVGAQSGNPLPKDTAVSAMLSKWDHKFSIESRESIYFELEHKHQRRELYEAAEKIMCETQVDSCTSTLCDAKMVSSCPIQLKKRPFLLRRNSSANGSDFCNVPRSPWISFPDLFRILESKREPQTLNLLRKLYIKFQYFEFKISKCLIYVPDKAVLLKQGYSKFYSLQGRSCCISSEDWLATQHSQHSLYHAQHQRCRMRSPQFGWHVFRSPKCLHSCSKTRRNVCSLVLWKQHLSVL